MEKYQIHSELKLICYKAKSFPEGIMDALNALEATVPGCDNRTWYGLSSQSEAGVIVYKAAVNELFDKEAEKYDLESFTITKGTYLTETILNWKDEMESFGPTFQKLLTDPRLDTNFPCLEWYKSDEEVMCMVRIIEK